jgi:hypothetical protein
MPRQVWDPQARMYRFEVEGIQVGGTSFTSYAAVANKLRDYNLTLDARPATISSTITELIAATFTATSWREVYNELVDRIKQKAPKKEPWEGKNGYIEWLSIPVTYRAALANLINNDNAMPGHDRGPHNTNPLKITGGGGQFREYDLTSTAQGRVTRCTKGGVHAFYYATTHAFGTYNYYLIVNGDKPVLRGAIDNINRVNV